jgi:hypothetical protein
MLSALACIIALISSYYLFRTIWEDVSGALIQNVRTPVSPGRIEQLEKRPREHPGSFDWHRHNELRHFYITSNPPNPRKSMEHSNVILQHSIMDDYILRILSEWQIDKNTSAARTNLMRNAQSFSDLRFVAAACFLKIGELYAAEGNREEANASYLKIVEDKSMPSQYRTLSGSNTQASITNGWIKRSVPIASRRAERTSTSVRKGLAPIGVDHEEIGATRHMGATVIRHGGIIPPMNGAGTRPTLARSASTTIRS